MFTASVSLNDSACLCTIPRLRCTPEVEDSGSAAPDVEELEERKREALLSLRRSQCSSTTSGRRPYAHDWSRTVGSRRRRSGDRDGEGRSSPQDADAVGHDRERGMAVARGASVARCEHRGAGETTGGRTVDDLARFVDECGRQEHAPRQASAGAGRARAPFSLLGPAPHRPVDRHAGLRCRAAGSRRRYHAGRRTLWGSVGACEQGRVSQPGSDRHSDLPPGPVPPRGPTSRLTSLKSESYC